MAITNFPVSHFRSQIQNKTFSLKREHFCCSSQHTEKKGNHSVQNSGICLPWVCSALALSPGHWFQTATWALRFRHVVWTFRCFTGLSDPKHTALGQMSMTLNELASHGTSGGGGGKGREGGEGSVKEGKVWGWGTLGFLFLSLCLPLRYPWQFLPPTFLSKIFLGPKLSWPGRLQRTISLTSPHP